METPEIVDRPAPAEEEAVPAAPGTPAGAGPPRAPAPDLLRGDLAYQNAILPGVSRTFALTIPVLPEGLRDVVANNYLLCRIADTVEDEATLPFAQKRDFSRRFAAVVAGEEDAESFAAELHPLLSERTLADERDLVRNAASVVRVTHSFRGRQREALARCLRIMCEGMERFQGREDQVRGLRDLEELGQYCYYVAGVVGETLTELFCDHSPEVNARADELRRLSVSFGQGLQMTNILKDIWDDLDRGFCWLPREVFARHGFDLDDLRPGSDDPGFAAALGELVGVARGHLEDALRYTLLLPAREAGMRRFCLWALGMAVLTIRKVHARRSFSSGQEVKISRRSVRATVRVTNLATRSDVALRGLFRLAALGLPRATRTPA